MCHVDGCIFSGICWICLDFDIVIGHHDNLKTSGKECRDRDTNLDTIGNVVCHVDLMVAIFKDLLDMVIAAIVIGHDNLKMSGK